MRSASLVMLLMLFSVISAVAQKDMHANTSGICSPVVTGGSSQITINCNGLSAAKATQLVTLMNRILAERLDVSEVNSKLDQLQKDIGSLNAALKPLPPLPAPILARLKQSQVLLTQCSTLMSDWTEENSERTREEREAVHKAREANLDSARSLSDTSESDQERAQDFARTYGPKLASINGALHRQMPDAPVVTDVLSPTTPTEAGHYSLQVLILSQRYKQLQNQRNMPINTRLVEDAARVFQDVNVFVREWIDANMKKLQSGHTIARTPTTSVTGFTVAVDQQEAERYRTKLKPQLVEFRDAVAPLVPEAASGKDYAAVATSMQLSGVCSDVANLSNAYRQKVMEDQQQQRVSSSKE